jgi:hypothetical protein
MNCPQCGWSPLLNMHSCDFCNQEIQVDQQIQAVPPVMVVTIGMKSGQKILIPLDPVKTKWDCIHIYCLQEYSNPEYNGGAEQLQSMLVEEARQENRSNFIEAAIDQLDETLEARDISEEIREDILEEFRVRLENDT